jgi:hypothetical protein
MTQATDFNSALREDAIDIPVSAGAIVQAPDQRADFTFDFESADVRMFERVDDNLVIILNDGSTVQIVDFYASVYENALVFREEVDAVFSTSGLALGGVGLLGAAGTAAALGGGGDGGSGGPYVTLDSGIGGGDGVVNGTEANSSFTVTGTASPGATVTVTIGNSTETVVANGSGNWSATFAPSDLPSGETETAITVTADDGNGNQAVVSERITFDTEVNDLTLAALPLGSDNVLNAAEAASGLTLTGTVEPGSVVVVTLGGVNHTAQVDVHGNWTVDIPASAVPASNGGTHQVLVTATDAAGNVDTVTQNMVIDTQTPDMPEIDHVQFGVQGVDEITLEAPADGTISLYQSNGSGGVSPVTWSNPAGNDVDLALGQTVADLILSVNDTAGNAQSTYYVFDAPGRGNTVTMDGAGFGNHNIQTINLEFEEVDLVLTEASIVGLSDSTNTVIIEGDSLDTVTIAGATQGEVVNDGAGNSYVEYTLGEATIWVDQLIPAANVITT